MTSARRTLIDAETTPFYHVINRCVRRAYLCGEDKLTGKSFEHRRGWIVDKIKALSTIFCIDICAYAVMSNHYHLVLKIDLNEANALSHRDVISRWQQLFHGKKKTGQTDLLLYVERYIGRRSKSANRFTH